MLLNHVDEANSTKYNINLEMYVLSLKQPLNMF